LIAGADFTGGREEALKHWCMTHQIKACELNLVG
jgi:putative mRNA 3-end processing factor